MQIELLWIIPIVSFSFFIFILIFFAQKKSERVSELSKEVHRFNNGIIAKNPVQEERPEKHLGELEKSILFLTDSITNQQKIIEGFQQKNNANQNEVNELRVKLRELYKEYDIIVSENYTLRAKMKKLQGQKLSESETGDSVTEITQLDELQSLSNNQNSIAKSTLRLYEDTRLLNMNSLEDTSEIDLAQAR
jgi:septal ring factor EnvC (AmiA/AmiB activator)